MPTKDELVEVNEELQETVNDLQEALAAAGGTEPAAGGTEPAPPVMVRMYWPHNVDLSTGLEPSVFGIKLYQDGDGNWYGMMTQERAATELTRTTGAFVDELEAPTGDDEEDNDDDE